MLKFVPILMALALAATTSAPAVAGPGGGWHETEGASIRVVTMETPDADGVLRGALQIDLKPGWKTYWRDPGESGVPPTVSVVGNENVGDPEIGFPAPARFDDGYSQFAGYGEPVALPLSFAIADGAGELGFEVDVFLGICETICIPVQATLGVDPSYASGEHEVAIELAFASLPEAAHEDFHARSIEVDQERLLVEVRLPAGSGRADLFVASTEQVMLGLPDRIEGDVKLFSVPLFGSDDTAGEFQASYTLVVDDQAVSGTLVVKP